MGYSSTPPLSLLLSCYDIMGPAQLEKWLALFCDETKLPDLDKYGEREGKGTGRGRRREDKRERVGKTGEGEGREGGESQRKSEERGDN